MDLGGMEHGGDLEDSEQVVPGLHSSGHVLNGIGGPREWTTSQEDDLPGLQILKVSLRRCRASYVWETMSISRLKEATLMGRDASRQDDTLQSSASMWSEEYNAIWKDSFAVFSILEDTLERTMEDTEAERSTFDEVRTEEDLGGGMMKSEKEKEVNQEEGHGALGQGG